MTRAVRFWGNIVIGASYADRPKVKTSDPWSAQALWLSAGGDANPTITVSPSYARILGFTIQEDVRGAGIVRYHGSITGIIGGMTSGQKCRVEIIPAIGVAQNPVAVYSQGSNNNWECIVTVTQGDRVTIPFDAVIPVAGWNSGGGESQALKAGVWVRVASVDGGSPQIEVTRFYGILDFTPTDNPDRFRRYSAIGHLSEGEGAMKRIYL